jgi:diacylglycerol kinase (ATP)
VLVRWTSARGDAARAVRDAANTPEPPDVVVAVGGDGTVLELAEGLLAIEPAERRPALFVVPAGTGNSNYLAQWGDLPWTEALNRALGIGAAPPRRLDLARLVETDELVLLGACSGIGAEALYAARDITLSGPSRYQAALAVAARDCKPYPGRVIVDGRVVHSGNTILANVGGGRYRAGTYRLLPHSILDDGELDVCVIGDEIEPVDVPELTRTGAHLDAPGVVYARGCRITVERTDGEALWFEHDGELLAGVSPRFTLQVLPNALPVLCRAATVDG